jgi:hypothetical protein
MTRKMSQQGKRRDENDTHKAVIVDNEKLSETFLSYLNLLCRPYVRNI